MSSQVDISDLNFRMLVAEEIGMISNLSINRQEGEKNRVVEENCL